MRTSTLINGDETDCCKRYYQESHKFKARFTTGEQCKKPIRLPAECKYMSENAAGTLSLSTTTAATPSPTPYFGGVLPLLYICLPLTPPSRQNKKTKKQQLRVPGCQASCRHTALWPPAPADSLDLSLQECWDEDARRLPSPHHTQQLH